MSQTQIPILPKENEQATTMNDQGNLAESGRDAQTENSQSSNMVDYAKLLDAGFSHQEIQDYMRPKLADAGFADQEINAYFNKFQIADGTKDASPKATLMQYFKHGLEGSVAGLAWNERLPDSVTENQLKDADWWDRFALGVGQMIGDLPTLAVGGISGGAAGTVAGPAGIMAGSMGGAMALTEGMRRAYIERIAAGNVQDYDYLKGAFNILSDAAKGFNTGALTGIAGGAAGAALTKAGAGVATQMIGSAAAEVGTMVTTQAAQELRLPHPQDFVDATLFVVGMRVAGAGLKQVRNVAVDLTPKMREIYAKVGKTPEEVAQAAQEDPTVKQDLLSVNRDVPGAFAQETKERVIRNEPVPSEELQHYRPRPWAEAELLARAGEDEVNKKISEVISLAEQKKSSYGVKERLYWQIVREDEANKLSEDSGLKIPVGMVHSIDPNTLRHAYNKHGPNGYHPEQGQVPLTYGDFVKIPDIIRNYDSVQIAKDNKGRDVRGLQYIKKFGDTYYIVEEVGKETLAFGSMWKIKEKEDLPRDFSAVGSAASIERNLPSSKPAELTSETTTVGPAAPDAASTANIMSATKPVNEGTQVQAPTTGSLVEGNQGQRFSTGGPTEVPIDPNKPVVPANGKLRHEDAVALSSVVEDLATALDTPIRVGKLGNVSKKVLGIFKEKPEVIRTRVANDITTVVHEAGHAIQKALFGQIDDVPLQPFASELSPIATQPGRGQSALPEGFAEFVAKYVCNPEEAKRLAPQFYDHFEQLLRDKSPEFSNALLNAREVVRKWAEQPAAQEVLSHINIEGREKEGLLARMLSHDTWERLYTNFVDRLYPLKKATEYLADGRELPAEMNPYTLARTFAGAKGKATHFLEHSPFKFKTWENVGKPLSNILKRAENLDEFRSFLVSRRGLELEARGIRSGVRKEAMEATVGQFEGKYGALAKELDEYQDHLVNYLVDSGVMSKESAQAMREMNKSYVPFYRVMEKEEGFLGGAKNFAARNPIRRIRGSGRDIIDPLESIIKNTYAIIEAAEKNAVGKALTNLAEAKEGSGWLIEKLPTPKQAVKVSIDQVNKAFMESLGDLDPATKQTIEDAIKAANSDEMVTFWQNSYLIDKENQIAVFRDGKREIYQIDPELAEVMNGLKAEQIPFLFKLISIPAKMLRAGATLTPDFMVRNMIRDAVSSGVVSRSGFTPGLDTVKGLKHGVMRDETYWNWVKAGGDQASVVSVDRTTLQKKVNDLSATGYFERVWNVVKNPMELLRLGSELSEKMTRLGEFEKATKIHGTDKTGLMQSAYESRDLMDFSRRGRLTGTFNIMTAFFNASVQGLDRMVRGFKENPKKFALRAALYIGIPSVINAIRNYGDKDIEEIPRAQRDMFWCVPIGEGKDKTIVRIPKPFEQGVLFGSTLERAVEFILDACTAKHGSIDKALSETFRGLGSSIWDVSFPNAVPTAFAPLLEQWANRSIPFDRPIVPANRTGLLPEYQYTNYTTELTKTLAHYIGTLPPVGEMNTFRPAVVENWIRGWTGGLGLYTMQALDALGKKASILPDPVKPTDTLADIPFVRAFVIRHPSMNAESIQRFMDSYDQARTYLQTINQLTKDFKYEDVANLLPYSAYQAIEGPKKAINEMTKTIDIIYKAPEINPDEKRQLIDSLYFKIIGIAKMGNKAFEDLQPTIEKLKERSEKAKGN